MKKALFLIISALFIFGCEHRHNIKNTSWYGIGKVEDYSIVFGDSTCETYIVFETGYIDTIKAVYQINHDTIKFIPFSDCVTIAPFVISEEELKDIETGETIFKLKK